MKISFMKEDAKASSPRAVYEALVPGYMTEKRECMGLVMVDIKKNIVANEIISIGTLDHTIVHPRDVFKAAVLASAHSIILIHNHPSGDTKPSDEDIETARKMKDAGRLMGIPLLDFLIVGDGYQSLSNDGLL